MRNPATYSFARLAGMLGFLAVLALPGAAHAADAAPGSDPFGVDNGNWESFDHYKEEKRQEVISAIYGKPTQEEGAAQAVAPADDKTAETAPANPAINAETAPLVLAQPERPLELPGMPQMNTQYNPAEQPGDSRSSAHIANIDTQPDLQLSRGGWEGADEAARQHAEGLDNDDDRKPLNVRFTPLPALSAQPAHKKSEPPPKAVAVAQEAAPEAPSIIPVHQASANTPSPAECAAVDNYKKQQLEAIQSDRNTLAALQDAVAQLGLKNQLGYMTGMNGKTNAATNSASADSTETTR